MEKISNLWFQEGRIFIKTDGGRTYSRPLEAFPTLMDATDEQRHDFKIGRLGDDVRWPSLDEDVHISSFTQDNTEPDTRNDIAQIFAMFPQLNVSEVARSIGINKSLLAKYIYGIKKPGEARRQEIIDALHNLGKALMAV